MDTLVAYSGVGMKMLGNRTLFQSGFFVKIQGVMNYRFTKDNRDYTPEEIGGMHIFWSFYSLS